MSPVSRLSASQHGVGIPDNQRRSAPHRSGELPVLRPGAAASCLACRLQCHRRACFYIVSHGRSDGGR